MQVVDFILHSADAALRKHFGESLASEGVQFLDPFAGTGTFPVRLIQSGLIGKEALPQKFAQELHGIGATHLAHVGHGDRGAEGSACGRLFVDREVGIGE